MQAIVAVSENWGIGKDNDLLFRISADLKRFKALTAGHTVIMGRKTLLSLPGGKGLPNRRNLVLTSDKSFTAENAETVNTLYEAVYTAGADAFVIGGATVYRQLLALCDRVYVTKVFASPEADAFFPDLDADPKWTVAEESEIMEENGLRFQYVDYVPCEEEDEFLPTADAEPTPFAITEGFNPFSGF
ncbi:MAG: dihydrofolate reductase [Oscillospiraceae bacterium]|nr:dihydrofolate reductase [Oscillospiraceae bacterium]